MAVLFYRVGGYSSIESDRYANDLLAYKYTAIYEPPPQSAKPRQAGPLGNQPNVNLGLGVIGVGTLLAIVHEIVMRARAKRRSF